jgi:UDP-N-acetylmuramoyl-L-alanyl-D-glutamate--2,6-diaminopimelate ligase
MITMGGAVSSSRTVRGMTLADLCRELPMATRVAGEASVRVTGVHHDSRVVERGDLFIAKRGRQADGSRFAGAAVARGASAVLAAPGSIDPAEIAVPVLFAEDPARALAFASSAVYGHPSFSLDVVGVTGTNGKTTTVHLVRAAIDGALGVPSTGTLGTVGHAFADWRATAEHTTPEADEIARVLAAMRDRGATHAAMEVSSHALALQRVAAVRFRVAAFTNLTQDHLDYHGSMDAYAEAKGLLFTALGPESAVVNVDDPFGRVVASKVTAPLVRVSARIGAAEDAAEIAPRAASIDARGIDAVIRTPAGDVRIASRLVGAHNLENLLVALGVAHALDLDLSRAAEALSGEAGAPGRLERCDVPGDDITVLVDYAHTPDALARVLDALRATSSGRIHCVFGCGGDRDATKREPMGRAVGTRADVAIVTNDNPRNEPPEVIAAAAAAGVRSAGLEPVVELDRDAAIDRAVATASPGDVVLIAGKGHEDYQIIARIKHPFDDRAAARRALATRRTVRGNR